MDTFQILADWINSFSKSERDRATLELINRVRIAMRLHKELSFAIGKMKEARLNLEKILGEEEARPIMDGPSTEAERGGQEGTTRATT